VPSIVLFLRSLVPQPHSSCRTAAANRRFSVRYKGIKIGTHTISYSSGTAETRVKTEINLEVKLAFITA